MTGLCVPRGAQFYCARTRGVGVEVAFNLRNRRRELPSNEERPELILRQLEAERGTWLIRFLAKGQFKIRTSPPR